MLSYRVTLDVPVQLVLFVSRLLADRRREIGTRRGTRALTCFGQAVFVLAWFRDRPDVRRLGQGSGISQATAYRYLDEAVEVRRERRAIRTAPAEGIDWPHAAQVLRIRRDSGPTHGPWTHKEIAYGITSLPADLADPRHLGIYARQHRAIENREHYVPDKTFGEDLQQVRTGNQPNAYAAIRNLVTGAFRRTGFANIAHARRYYGRDDERILALYGYV